MTQVYNMHQLTEEKITQLAQELSSGALAVFATDTVYGVGTGAFCEKSIARIYALKKRPASQPLQLLVGNLIHAQRVAQFSPGALHVAQVFWPGGLTLLLTPNEVGKPLLRGSKALGLRVPAYLPLLRILMQMPMPLASTSANLHGQAVLTREEDVLAFFNGKVDFILTDGTLSPLASTVLDVTDAQPLVLRPGTISQEELLRVFKDVEDFL